MLGGEGFEKVPHRSAFSTLCLFDPTGDAANRVEEFAIVEEPLVGLGALDDNLGLTVHCQNCGLSSVLQPLNVFPRISLKIAQGMDLRKVDSHGFNLQ